MTKRKPNKRTIAQHKIATQARSLVHAKREPVILLSIYDLLTAYSRVIERKR